MVIDDSRLTIDDLDLPTPGLTEEKTRIRRLVRGHPGLPALRSVRPGVQIVNRQS
jgi:hypothetical protein